MSYLLTEVAMEMLGWKFFDEEGVPRPINFEGANNVVCEGVEHLAVTLAAHYPNLPLTPAVVKAEADSSNNQPLQTGVFIDLDADSPESVNNESTTDDSYRQQRFVSECPSGKDLPQTSDGIALNPPAMEESSGTAANSNGSRSLLKPLDLKIGNVRGGYDPSLEENQRNSANDDHASKSQLAIVRVTSAGADVETNSVVTPANFTAMEPDLQVSHQSNAMDESSNSQANDFEFIDLTDDDRNVAGIEKLLEMEINQISTELKRQKLIFYEAIPDVLKYPPETYQSVLKSYRDQELKNLRTEYRNLLSLSQEAERISQQNFEQTYPTFLDISEKLSKLMPPEADDDQDMPSTSLNTKRKQVARKTTSKN